MAPIKFEEQLKDKLEKRSIQPSQDAWNKLSERLDEVDESKNNKGFWWLGIAATIVGVLLALTFVFKSNSEIIEPTIVDTTKEDLIENQDATTIKETESITEVVAETTTNQIEKTQEKSKVNQVNKAPLETIITKKQEALVPNKINEVVAAQKTENPKELNKELPKKAAEILSFEDQKVKDVVAKINELKKEHTEVTTEQIDKLLEEAQKEITMQKLYNEATKTVDADALLKSVEEDLEQSFRNKVFEAIKSGYDTVKTAVAERNN